jgi:hypothetical protein
MTEKTSTNTLENYLIQAKNLTDHSSAADLIKRVIECPLVYSFSELLEVPQISSVSKLYLLINKIT